MATQRWILFLLPAAMLSLFAGCGGSTANVQNPPPPPQSTITIAFQPEPASTIAVGFSENVTAVVTNDSSNSGVTWELTCQADPGNKTGLCGTLSALHTASGSPTTYTAPTTLSASSMAVEVVALATANQNANVVAPITVSTFDSTFQAGTYILQAQGVQSGYPYQFAAAIVLDAQGNITNGEQTANSSLVSISDQNLTGNYFIGSDGRGTITINDPDTNVGVETFAFVYLNSSQALISQMDFGNANTGASATGTMTFQTSTAAPTGSYAFVTNGMNVVELQDLPFALGGVFDIAPGQTAITGVYDEIINFHVKENDAGFQSGSQLTSGPDSLGQVTITLAGISDTIHPKLVNAIFAGYIVDSSHIQLIETDTATNSGITPLAVTGGIAIGQASGSYGNFDNASFTGTYVFGITGMDLYPTGTYVPNTWTTAGLMTADGNGNITSGYSDNFLQENCNQSTCKTNGIVGAQISASFTGTYFVDTGGSDPGSGTGRTTLNNFTFNPAPTPSYSPNYFIYLTGDGAAGSTALILAAGDITSNPKLHYPSIGTGIAYLQSTSAAAFNGPYGLSFTQVNSSGENDGTAQFTANSTTTPPSLSGYADINLTTSANLDQPFTGTYSAPIETGPFAGTLTGTNNTVVSSVAFTPPIAVDYFFIDPDHGFFVESDLVNPSPGSGQVSFGYYAERTPLCQGCP